MANDYNPRPLENEQSFHSTKRPMQYAEGRPDRAEDYAEEARISRESLLLAPQ